MWRKNLYQNDGFLFFLTRRILYRGWYILPFRWKSKQSTFHIVAQRESFVNRWLINWSEKMPKRWLDWLNVYLYILRITRIEAKYFDGLYKLNFQHAHKNSCVLKYHHRNQPFIVEQSDCKHALNKIYIVICVHGMRWCTLKVYLGCNYTNLVKPFGICALLNYK